MQVPAWILYPMALKCAKADVSNLVAESGPEVTIMVNHIDDYLRALYKVLGSPTNRWVNGTQAAGFLKKASGQGASPISRTIIAGHSNGGLLLGTRSGDQLFTPQDIFKVADEKENSRITS